MARDYGAASSIFTANCEERDHGNSCFALAQLWQARVQGATDAERKTKARQLYGKACALGTAQACGLVGAMKLQGFGGDTDVAGAKKALQQACDDNDAFGCFTLGRLYLKGSARGRPKADAKGAEVAPAAASDDRDPAKALPYMKRCCALGHPNGCQVVSVMYGKGDGVERNEKLHEHYKHRTHELVKLQGARMGADVV